MLIAHRRLSFFMFLLVASLSLNGCTYLKNRGNDARDIFDVGVTVNTSLKPQFAFYFDQFSIFTLGYSHFKGKIFGNVNSKDGLLDYENYDWGVVAWGSRKEGADPFDPTDPRQARADQKDLKERPRFDLGLARIPFSNDPPPWRQYIECHRIFHFGYVGIVFNLRPLDLIDFLVGWTTLDILHDDNRAGQAPAAASEPAAPAAKPATPAAK